MNIRNFKMQSAISLATTLAVAVAVINQAMAATSKYSYRQAMIGVTAEPPVPPTPPADYQSPSVFALPGTYTSFYEGRTNTTVPFTISAWVNVTKSASNSYLLSLSPYYNYNGPLHAGIVVKDGVLAYGRTYWFNSFNWGVTDPIQPMPVGTWTHITAQVDATHLLKVAVNGRFVYSRQLSSYLHATAQPEAGGSVGVTDPNAFMFPNASTGTIKQVQVWKSLVYSGTDFTPPPLNQ